MSKVKRSEIPLVIKEMKRLYNDAECALNHKNVFQLLVAVVLSAQTTDKSVNQVTPILFEKHPDAASIAAMSQAEIEEILKRIGMYRTKAKNVIALCNTLVQKYDGKVPEDYDQLVALPGVGRKTANVVLSVGFGQQRIAVDTHVFRLANRIGLTAEKDVLKTELALMKVIPKEHWTMMHHALIWHGRQVCVARNPRCQDCTIKVWCRRNGIDQKKGLGK
jgi:endonuclease III